jgi:hypothetical protein
MKIGFLLEKPIDKTRAQFMANVLRDTGLTLAELDQCVKEIATSSELNKEIIYSKAINASIFDAARKSKRVMKVRLFSRMEAISLWEDRTDPSITLSDMFEIIRDTDNHIYYQVR